jgi:hypothetical protein
MLCFDNDAALAHLLIAATAVPVEDRSRWLESLADQLEPSKASKGSGAGRTRRMISPGAERVRLHRKRLAVGRAVLRVEVDFNATSAALFSAGFIREGEIDDPEAVASALERVIALLPERLNTEV